MVSNGNMMVFTGNANPVLAQEVATHLGIQLGRADVGRFSDGEVMVELLENVRGRDVFVLQSTSHPTNDSLMEVMVMVDALRRASAGRITAAIPYFGYARQDRRPRLWAEFPLMVQVGEIDVAPACALIGCTESLPVPRCGRSRYGGLWRG